MAHTRFYNTLTVGQYQDILNIPEDITAFERLVYLVAILQGIDYDEALQIKRTQFDLIVREYTLTDFKNFEHEKKRSKIEVNGIPLEIQMYPEKLTAGQLLDNIHLLKEQGQDPLMIMDKRLATIMNVKGRKYNEEISAAEMANVVRQIPIRHLYSTYVFFFNNWNNYYQNSEDYLNKAMKDTLALAKEVLLASGGYSQS
jgi:hypothetical protein